MFVSIVGELVFGRLLGRHVATAPPPEGELNASSGSLAAFLAGLGALFSGMASIVMYRGHSDVPFALFFGIGLSSAVAAAILARRSFQVTKRRRALARGALWTARATIIVSAAMLGVSGVESILRVG